jgi:hypothetical protein
VRNVCTRIVVVVVGFVVFRKHNQSQKGTLQQPLDPFGREQKGFNSIIYCLRAQSPPPSHTHTYNCQQETLSIGLFVVVWMDVARLDVIAGPHPTTHLFIEYGRSIVTDSLKVCMKYSSSAGVTVTSFNIVQ